MLDMVKARLQSFGYEIKDGDSWNYGIETLDLYGQPVAWVCPELERRITEALTCDDRITSVSDFDFDTSKKGVVHCTFTAHTIFGDVQAEREVNF